MTILDPDFALHDSPAPTVGVVAVESEPQVQAAFDRALQGSRLHCKAVRLPGMTAAFEAALLVLPTMPAPPPTLEAARDGRPILGMTAFVRVFNRWGHPTLSLPLPAADGFSTGLQFAGRRGDDVALCALARGFEHALTREASTR